MSRLKSLPVGVGEFGRAFLRAWRLRSSVWPEKIKLGEFSAQGPDPMLRQNA